VHLRRIAELTDRWQTAFVAAAGKVRRAVSTGLAFGVAAAGWLVLPTSYYFELPLFGWLSPFGWLALAFCWAWAIVGSVVVCVVLVRRRGRAWAAVCGGVAVVMACGVLATNWLGVYADSQFRLQRDELAQLASRYRSGALPADALLPRRLRYLVSPGGAEGT
jgi:hypothetical protein